MVWQSPTSWGDRFPSDQLLKNWGDELGICLRLVESWNCPSRASEQNTLLFQKTAEEVWNKTGKCPAKSHESHARHTRSVLSSQHRSHTTHRVVTPPFFVGNLEPTRSRTRRPSLVGLNPVPGTPRSGTESLKWSNSQSGV